jgi:signal peptidase
MRFRNSLGTLGYVVLGILLAFVANQGLAFALSTDMPMVAVESNSMVPTFNRGDILILQGVPMEELEIGDVIVFSPEGRATPVVHRVIAKNPDGTFQTRGDANSGQLPFEKSIEPSQIHGRSIAAVPYLGWVKIGATTFLFKNPAMLLMGIASLFVIYIMVKGRPFRKI